MAVELAADARLVWGSLNGRDFAAVEQLIAELIEADNDGQQLDTAATGTTGYYNFQIIGTQRILAAVTNTPTGPLLFALGRPRRNH